MSVSIDLRGIAELAAKLNGIDPEDISKRIVTKAAIYGENLGKQRSPVDTGRLRSSITHRVDSPSSARYGTNVFYAVYLDKPSSRNPHYRRGPHAGASTAGWLSDTAQQVEQYVVGTIIPGEVRALEAAW